MLSGDYIHIAPAVGSEGSRDTHSYFLGQQPQTQRQDWTLDASPPSSGTVTLWLVTGHRLRKQKTGKYCRREGHSVPTSDSSFPVKESLLLSPWSPRFQMYLLPVSGEELFLVTSLPPGKQIFALLLTVTLTQTSPCLASCFSAVESWDSVLRNPLLPHI